MPFGLRSSRADGTRQRHRVRVGRSMLTPDPAGPARRTNVAAVRFVFTCQRTGLRPTLNIVPMIENGSDFGENQLRPTNKPHCPMGRQE